MRWYIPSWNGDLRLVPDEKDPQRTILHVEKPTPSEQQIVNRIGTECVNRGWLDKWTVETPKKVIFATRKKFTINAPLEEVGPVVAKLVKPGPTALTAVRFKDGNIETCSGSVIELEELSKKAASQPAEKAATAAVTVTRPTPCCPNCVPGSTAPAREVLLSFLNEEEHAQWAADRLIVVEGGLSKHRYAIAHRNSSRAQAWTRICLDLDDGAVLHFHDWSVPPEEEVLAAKLILEHREPWLRNEATALGPFESVFKNPFGGLTDGVWDAGLVRAIGTIASALR